MVLPLFVEAIPVETGVSVGGAALLAEAEAAFFLRDLLFRLACEWEPRLEAFTEERFEPFEVLFGRRGPGFFFAGASRSAFVLALQTERMLFRVVALRSTLSPTFFM